MDGRQALAQAFDDWYARSGLNQSQVAAAGGPSTTTQTKVRQSDGPVSRQTLKQIDHVTGWAPGTAARYLSGEPVAIVPPAQLGELSDDDLLAEIRRRMKGASWLAAERPEDSLPAADPVVDTDPAIDLLADPPPAESDGSRSPRAVRARPSRQ